MAIEKVGVVGCGLMGSGIAQIAAQAGCTVVVREVSEERLNKGLASIEKSLNKFVEKGTLSAADRDAARGRLRGTTKLEDLKDSDLIVEAIIEQLPDKRELYSALDKICPKNTIFASNTSSLSITEMAFMTARPDRFIGLHFFNPVPLMKLVEVIRTIATDPKVYEDAVAFAGRVGKVPVRTSDRTGFIVNRLLVPYLLDAVRVLEAGSRVHRRHRQFDEAWLRLSHGPVDAARFRGQRHDVLHREHHVRRIQGSAFCAAAIAETHGPRRMERTQGRTRFLRLFGSRQAESHTTDVIRKIERWSQADGL